MAILYFFTFLVLSPWPLFFSYFFYYWATLDSSYNPLIYSKKILYKHGIFLGFIVILCSTIFMFRVGQMGREIDFLNTFYMFWDLFTFLPAFQGYLLFLSIIIMGIFWFFLFSRFYTYIRRSCMVLYVYYDQFDKFTKIRRIILNIKGNFLNFLTDRVFKFTKNNRILHYAHGIWPLTPELIERNIFRFLVPYLYIFDICVKNGMVSLVFYVLPWMFVYSIIRSSYKLFLTIFRLRLLDVTIFLYGLDSDSQDLKDYYK